MGEKYLIDTSVYSKFITDVLSEKGLELLSEIELPNISIITKIELLSWNTSNEVMVAVTDFITDSQIFELSESVISKTVQIRKTTKIKLPDAIIAATAIVNDFILLSTNDKDFMKVKELKYLSLN